VYDQPTLAELVAVVREFLEHRALPALEGHTAFHARVAANALGIVERQLEHGTEAEAAERARLEALLGRTGTLDELNRELCRRIRAEEIGGDDADLMRHLRETTLAKLAVAKLAVDQPNYSRYRKALEG
jgi:hypothetical protein